MNLQANVNQFIGMASQVAGVVNTAQQFKQQDEINKLNKQTEARDKAISNVQGSFTKDKKGNFRDAKTGKFIKNADANKKIAAIKNLQEQNEVINKQREEFQQRLDMLKKRAELGGKL